MKRGPIVSIDTKIAGLKYKNEDGTSRRKIVDKTNEKEALILKREPNNPYDKNAVKVMNFKGEHLGYLPKDDAKQVSPYLDKGYNINCLVNYKTKSSCHIYITINSLENTDNESSEKGIKSLIKKILKI